MKDSHKENKNIYPANNFVDLFRRSHQSSGDIFFCAHMGPSMNPTLTPQDLLEIKPYKNESPRIGDVILYYSPQQSNNAIHRIVSIDANGIQTRGDNNCITDTESLHPDDIAGRVVAAQRGSFRRKIANGYWGSLVGRYCHMRRLVHRHTIRLLGPVYRSLCAGNFLHRFIPCRLQTRIATFQSATHITHKLLLGHRIIGAYDETSRQWQIRRPYRLFVDQASLPVPR